jgi:hypothetical protein
MNIREEKHEKVVVENAPKQEALEWAKKEI